MVAKVMAVKEALSGPGTSFPRTARSAGTHPMTDRLGARGDGWARADGWGRGGTGQRWHREEQYA